MAALPQAHSARTLGKRVRLVLLGLALVGLDCVGIGRLPVLIQAEGLASRLQALLCESERGRRTRKISPMRAHEKYAWDGNLPENDS